MVVACCLRYMNEEEAFATASSLLAEGSFFLNTRRDTWIMVVAFDSLAAKLLPKSYKVVMDAFSSTADHKHPMSGIVQRWICDHLPKSSLMVLIDNFIVKGPKIFYRFGLAIVQRWARELQLSTVPVTADDTASRAIDASDLAAEAFAFK